MTNTRESRFDTSAAVAAAFGRPLIAYGLPVGAALAIGEVATRLTPPLVATLVTVILLVVAHAVGAAAVARLTSCATDASVTTSWSFAGRRLPRALLGTVYPAVFALIAALLVTAIGVLLPGMPPFVALALILLVAIVTVPTLRTLPLLVLTERRAVAAIRDSWGPTTASRTAPAMVVAATLAALVLGSFALAPVAAPIVTGIVLSLVAIVGMTVLVTVATAQAQHRVHELGDVAPMAP